MDRGDKMIIERVNIRNYGYVSCKSAFYSAEDGLSECTQYNFSTGINRLVGEIDSGNWAVSYTMSMYKARPKDFILFEKPEAIVNNEPMSLGELCKFSCYMDESYPLFSSKHSIRNLITKGLRNSQVGFTVDELKNMFYLDDQRFERPLTQVGNEIFRSMAAIGVAFGKEIFCFPWLSSRRFHGYHNNLSGLLEILEDLKKIVIVPIGVENPHR